MACNWYLINKYIQFKIFKLLYYIIIKKGVFGFGLICSLLKLKMIKFGSHKINCFMEMKKLAILNNIFIVFISLWIFCLRLDRDLWKFLRTKKEYFLLSSALFKFLFMLSVMVLLPRKANYSLNSSNFCLEQLSIFVIYI